MSDAASIKVKPSELLEIANMFYKEAVEYKKRLENNSLEKRPNPELYISIGDVDVCVGISWYPEYDTNGKIINL